MCGETIIYDRALKSIYVLNTFIDMTFFHKRNIKIGFFFLMAPGEK